jgi:hypothetical protein
MGTTEVTDFPVLYLFIVVLGTLYVRAASLTPEYAVSTQGKIIKKSSNNVLSFSRPEPLAPEWRKMVGKCTIQKRC